jgi:hypothetical protein
VTAETEREAALDQLREALRTDDADETKFHVREAIQLLQFAETATPTVGNDATEAVE